MLRGGGGAPLLLQACKTSVGHTEPAAGAVGLLHALATIHEHAAAGILHLRTVRVRSHACGSSWCTRPPRSTQVNQHIQPASMAQMSAPRQQAPLVQESPTVGISAFAFQGTNAHALLCAPASSRATSKENTIHTHWERRHVSVAPAQHPLLRSATAAPASVTFACSLHHPCNAFLWQHVVGDRPLLPATAYLEIMHAALTTTGAQHVASLADVAFKRPCLLTDKVSLAVQVHLDSGLVEVVCGTAVHATAASGAGSCEHSKPTSAWPLLAADQQSASDGVADITLHPEAAGLFTMHPAALDSVLQLAAGCQWPEQLPSVPSVPASLAAYAPRGTVSEQCLHAVGSTRPGPRGGATSTLRMLGVCALADLVSMPLSAPKQAAAPSHTGMYALSWLAERVDVQPPPLLPLLQLQPVDATAALAAVQCASAASIMGTSLPPEVAGLLRSAASERGSCVQASCGAAPTLLLTEEDVDRGDGYGPRISASASKVAVLRRAGHAQPLSYQLCPQPRGALHNLVAVPVEASPRMPMLRVQATGINFRDVLNVLVRCAVCNLLARVGNMVITGHVPWRSRRPWQRLCRGRGKRCSS